jgi:hypothetical protein
MSGKQRRKEEVKRLRQEGADAFAAGKRITQNPYRFMDGYQWSQGWNSAYLAMPRKECQTCGRPLEDDSCDT